MQKHLEGRDLQEKQEHVKPSAHCLIFTDTNNPESSRPAHNITWRDRL